MCVQIICGVSGIGHRLNRTLSGCVSWHLGIVKWMDGVNVRFHAEYTGLKRTAHETIPKISVHISWASAVNGELTNSVNLELSEATE